MMLPITINPTIKKFECYLLELEHTYPGGQLYMK